MALMRVLRDGSRVALTLSLAVDVALGRRGEV